jgi:hypothetical protein
MSSNVDRVTALGIIETPVIPRPKFEVAPAVFVLIAVCLSFCYSASYAHQPSGNLNRSRLLRRVLRSALPDDSSSQLKSSLQTVALHSQYDTSARIQCCGLLATEDRDFPIDPLGMPSWRDRSPPQA